MRLRLFVVLVVLSTTVSLYAENSTIDPAAVLENVSVYGNTPNLTARIQMKIATSRGVQNRVLEAYVKRTADASETFIRMISPAFLSNMKFLSKRSSSGTEVHWIGTSRGVRRVATGGSNTEHLFDSDFTVEDLSSISVDRYRLRVLPKRQIEGRTCLSIEARPKYSGADYVRKIIYVEVGSMLLMGIDYFDSRGQIVRSYRTTSTQRVSGQELPRTCVMSTPENGSSTVLTFERVETARPIPERVFNIGNM